MQAGERICVFSGELPAGAARLTKQITGIDRPSQSFLRHVADCRIALGVRHGGDCDHR